MEELQKEQQYHLETLKIIDRNLLKENDFLSFLRKDDRKLNREMMNETSNDYSDLAVRAELSQYLQAYRDNQNRLNRSVNKVEKLLRMKDKPYFGRLDFIENGCDKTPLYIGIAHLFDNETLDIRVYDWRSPIASLYYENQYGELSYEAPEGKITGHVTLKRQFLFEAGKIINYYDLKENVADQQLLDVLSKSSDQKLHAVVETIQKKQNDIIRAKDLDLLFVNGVPGSGKSIIAIHRLAYLMYHGKNKYKSENMLIISPNQFFKQYIDEVLPELGESTVKQYTYEDLMTNTLGNYIETYTSHMDRIIAKKYAPFKQSKKFYLLLKAWFAYYLKHLHPYEDLYYHHQVLVTRQQIKNRFLKLAFDKPLSIGADQFRARCISDVEYLARIVKPKMKDIIAALKNHLSDAPEALNGKVKKYTRRMHRQFDHVLNLKPRAIYEKMFENKALLRSLVDFEIPDNFFIRNNLYEDCHGLMLLNSWIHPMTDYKHYKYIVIDESQDYNYTQLHVLKHLFRNSHFTILGDMNQTLHHIKNADYENELLEVFQPKSMASIALETCYRSTEHITQFANQYIDNSVKPFARLGDKPQIIQTDKVMKTIKQSLEAMHEMKTVAIIVHSSKQANSLSKKLKIPAITGYHTSIDHPVAIFPVYFAKGLEFDGVIYLDDLKEHPLKNQYAYTAATRAKHLLTFVRKKQS